jgi:hypothetical protein
MHYAKQKKYESIEDYYDRFLWLRAIIPQQSNDIYFKETLRKDLKTKVKIIGVPQRTLVEVVKSTKAVK